MKAFSSKTKQVEKCYKIKHFKLFYVAEKASRTILIYIIKHILADLLKFIGQNTIPEINYNYDGLKSDDLI